MKLQKQESQTMQPFHSIFSFTIDRIHIKVKFACRLYFEYLNKAESRKSQEIRIDPKTPYYKINEQIVWQSKNNVSSTDFEEEGVAIYVKLLSNKGLAFTAGVINLTAKNYIAFDQQFTLKLTKSLDFDAFCECTRTDLFKEKNTEVDCNLDKYRSTPSQGNRRDSCISSEQQKAKNQRDYSTIKNEIEREQDFKSLLNSRIDSKASERKIRRTESLEDYKHREKELLRRIEDLQSEIHKNGVLFDKQKEIIALLELKQREFNAEKNELKTQVKAIEIDLDDKRQKIRELQGEKLRLLMSTLTVEKELATSKQKIGSLMEKVYERIKRLFHEKNQKVFIQYAQKSPKKDKCKEELKGSLSKINTKNGNVKRSQGQSKQLKDASELSKMAFSAVRGLINKEVDQAWLEQSLGNRDSNPSEAFSSTLNDMSISKINGKVKQVSLLNSELFLKPQESEHFNSSPSISKHFIEEISKSLNKLETMIAAKIQKTIQTFVEILERNQGGKDTSNTQESLLGYLQQLETGFERQLGALGQKERIIAYYEQLIQQLNNTLSQKQNLVVQLEEHLFRLEEEKDHVKSELHDANYAHSLKEEELMKKIHILEHGKSMPDYSSSASPTHKPQARRKEPKVPNSAYQQEIIQYKEHLRLMEIDLLHQRDEREKAMHGLHEKQLELQEALNEIRRLEFAIRMRERMASLNESIEFSAEEESPPKNQQKFTQQSLGNEQDFLNILIYQQ